MTTPHRHARSVLAVAIAGIFASPGAFASPPAPTTLPTGGQVVSGQATIGTVGATMSVNQSTQQAILNWQSFSIGSGAAVNFIQPNAGSVALNRVLGPDPSAIYGKLTANGQVFLVNPNGVLFGPGAKVDVGGLVASTLAIRNEDFLAGRHRFTREGTAASVVNQGELIGKYIALLAPEVRNEGIITARMGTAALAAGDAVTLDISGNRLVGVQVDRASIATLVENRNLIQVDAGTVVLSSQSANALLGRVVNSGDVAANGISTDGGVVRLLASSSVEHSGRISADAGTSGEGGSVILLADLGNPASRTTVSGRLSARGGAQGGDGGFIETSASKLKIADSVRIDTSAANGAAGQWLLDPFDFTIAAANGDITGAALSAALATNDVTIATADTNAACTTTGVITCGTGNPLGSGDIFVNDSVSWAAPTKLTLSAWRNVVVNAPVGVSDAGGSLALRYAQSDTTLNFPVGTYLINAPVSLATGAGFSTKAASDGPVINHTVVNDATALANIAGNLAGNYVLGGDVAAPGSSWTPLGNTATPFTGTFDGLGHRITGLMHTNGGSDVDVGLFGGNTGLIQNVGVTGVNIEGSQNVGALVGFNNGFVVNSYSTGTVIGSGAGSVGRIGGLVGFSMGPIQASYSSASVTAAVGDQVGDPLAEGKGGIGGLAGVVGSAVGDSYATGSVNGLNAVGGLVGYSGAGISNSYSTGAVTGSTNVNGLVGQVMDPFSFIPFIFGSFWDTQSSGQATGGGGTNDFITGLNTAGMKTPASFTSAGWDTASVWELRTGQYPLLKQMLTPIYVIADHKAAVYTANAFTAFTSTMSTPAGMPGGATAGAATYTPSTLNPTNVGAYAVVPGGVTVASAGDQHGYRVEFVGATLTITPATLTYTANAAGRAYGDANPAFTGSVTGFVGGETLATATTGAAAFSSPAGAASGVGSYAINGAGLAANNGNYTFAQAAANANALTISKANLTVTADNKSRVVGDPNPLFTQTISGFKNGENATSANVTGAAQGSSTANAASPAGIEVITASAGTLDAPNYGFTTLVDGTLTITPVAPVVVVAAAGDTTSASEAAKKAVEQAQKPPQDATPGSLSGTHKTGGKVTGADSPAQSASLLPTSGEKTQLDAAGKQVAAGTATPPAKDWSATVDTLVNGATAPLRAFGLAMGALLGGSNTPEYKAKMAEIDADAAKAKPLMDKLDKDGQALLQQILADKNAQFNAANASAKANQDLADAKLKAQDAQNKADDSRRKADLALKAAADNPQSVELALAANAAKLRSNLDNLAAGKANLAVADAQAVAVAKSGEHQNAVSQGEVTTAKLVVHLADAESREAEDKAKEATATYFAAAVNAGISKLMTGFAEGETVRTAAEATAAEAAKPSEFQIWQKQRAAQDAEYTASLSKSESDAQAALAARLASFAVADKDAPEKFTVIEQMKALVSASESMPADLNSRLKQLWGHGALNELRSLEQIKSDFEEAKALMDEYARRSGDARAREALDANRLEVQRADNMKIFSDHLKREQATASTKANAAAATAKEAAAAAAKALAEAEKLAKDAAADESKRAAADAAAQKAADARAMAERMGSVASTAQKAAEQSALDAAEARAQSDKAAEESKAARAIVAKAEAEKAAAEKLRKEQALAAARVAAEKKVEFARQSTKEAQDAEAAAAKANAAVAQAKADKAAAEAASAKATAAIPATARVAAADAAAVTKGEAELKLLVSDTDRLLKEANAATEATNALVGDLSKALGALTRARFDAATQGSADEYSIGLTLLQGGSVKEALGLDALDAIDEAAAEVAKVQKEYNDLRAVAETKRAAYEAAKKKEDDAIAALNAAKVKWATSQQAANQAELDKKTADQNVKVAEHNLPIYESNAKSSARYAAELRIYAAEVEAEAKAELASLGS